MQSCEPRPSTRAWQAVSHWTRRSPGTNSDGILTASVSATCAECVIFSLARPDKAAAVIACTRCRGRATHGSIFRMPRGWQSPIKCGKCSEPLTVWRQNVALKNDRYTYRVTWSQEDNEHVGLCAEFPSLSWLARTPEAALKGIRKVVANVVADLEANGEAMPEPIAIKQYSGKFMVRVPPDLHRRLVLEAAEAGVSLNRIASAKLSR